MFAPFVLRTFPPRAGETQRLPLWVSAFAGMTVGFGYPSPLMCKGELKGGQSERSPSGGMNPLRLASLDASPFCFGKKGRDRAFAGMTYVGA